MLVSREKIANCVSINLHTLSFARSKQENLAEFAELVGFSLRDTDQGLAHSIVMGGAVGRGENWPLGWRDAKNSLSAEQVRAAESAYLKIIDEFPQELKDGHPALFA